MSTTVEKPIEIDSQRQWLKPREWRALTGMPNGTVNTLIRSGKLRAVRVGNRYYIPTTEITAFWQREGKPAA